MRLTLKDSKKDARKSRASFAFVSYRNEQVSTDTPDDNISLTLQHNKIVALLKIKNGGEAKANNNGFRI